jgi:hypothetical protein
LDTSFPLLLDVAIYLGSISTSGYLKVDGNMENKWETGIQMDLKRLFVSGTYIYLTLVMKGIKC